MLGINAGIPHFLLATMFHEETSSSRWAGTFAVRALSQQLVNKKKMHEI